MSVFTLIQIIDKITISGGILNVLYGSIILGVLYWTIKPLLNIVLFPLNLATLNISSWLVDIVIFYLWSIVFPQLKIGNWNFNGFSFGVVNLSAYTFSGWQMYVVSAIIMSLLLKLFNWLLK